MANSIDFKRPYIPIESIQNTAKTKNNDNATNKNNQTVENSDFKQLFNSALSNSALNKNQVNTTIPNNQITFSKHALQRIDQRQIDLTPQLMDKVTDAVSKAKDKGVKDALIIGNNIAFIVNIPNNTVITTLNGYEMKDNVFTNIDGTVLI